jgi:hypothetical protein
LISLLLIALWACGGAVEAPPIPSSTPVAAAPAKVEPEAPSNPKEKPLPATADEGLKATTIAGYGISVEIRPPFQAMRARLAEVDDQIILTWWDVSVAGAGGHVARGIYSVALVPGQDVAPEEDFTRVVTEDAHKPVVFRLGEQGTEVRLEAPLGDLSDIGATLGRGPATPSWSIDGSAPETWASHLLLQSADPASGQTYELVQTPSRPWGPWPASADPPQP